MQVVFNAINSYVSTVSMFKNSNGDRKDYAQEEMKTLENKLYELYESNDTPDSMKSKIETALNIPQVA